MSNVLIIVVLIVLLLLAFFIIPRWRIRRAIRQVILIFRKNNATNVKNAKTMDELGLSPRGMLEGIMRGRDYKQYALSALIRIEVIQETEDGKLYLSEEKLADSGLDTGISYYG